DGVHQQHAETGAAGRTADGEAAEVPHVAEGGVDVGETGRLDHQSAGADRRAVDRGEEMVGALVVVIQLEVLGYSLLDDEDLVAERVGGRDLCLVAGQPNLCCHHAPSARSRSSAVARSSGYSLLNSTRSPVAGWSKANRTACSHCLVRPRRA